MMATAGASLESRASNRRPAISRDLSTLKYSGVTELYRTVTSPFGNGVPSMLKGKLSCPKNPKLITAALSTPGVASIRSKVCATNASRF